MTTLNRALSGAGIATIMSASHKFSPQICLDKPNDQGADDAAAKAAAEKAAAEKAAADAAAKEKADKEAAEKELAEKLKGLSDSEANPLKENMKQKEAVKKAKADLDAAKAALAAFDGIDPAEVKKLVEAQKEAEKAKLEAEKAAAEKAGDFERVKKMMAEEHQKALDAVKGQTTELQNLLKLARGQIDDLTVGSSFGNSQYVKDNLVLSPAKARVVYGDHFEVENGVIVGYDKPKGQSARTKLVDASGNPMKFDDALTKLVLADPDKDTVLKSTLKPGTGGKPADDKGGKTPEKGLTGVARIQAALKAKAAAAGQV